MAVAQDASSTRGVGALLLLSTAAQILLLALHPETSAHDFAGMMREEAAGQTMDAIVHGGFVVLLGIQLVCYAILSARLGLAHTATVAALIFFAIGSAFLMASVTIDGLILPRVAGHYAHATPEMQNSVRAVFAFGAAAIGWLMPIGVFFQGAGIASWGLRLMHVARQSGGAALLLGVGIAAMPVVALVGANPALIMFALLGTALWALIGGVWLMRRLPA